MLKYKLYHRDLIFNFPAKTSRGSMAQKETYFLKLMDEDGKVGIGEISPLPGLSPEYQENFESLIRALLDGILNDDHPSTDGLKKHPSILFGLETALRSLRSKNPMLLYESSFTHKEIGIKTNGLIWMGELDFMLEQLHKKVEDGFTCIKIKVGAINLESELELISHIRNSYSEKNLEIRLDANGSFSPENALKILDKFNKFGIHSIEQPIKAGNFKAMNQLCRETSIPIALDEELIGKYNKDEKEMVLDSIDPQYIILKPSLLGGIESCEEWISLASARSIKWWATSALESNIGLNAIAQWTATKNNSLPQGLGTGMLYHNNIDSPLFIEKEYLYYSESKPWILPF